MRIKKLFSTALFVLAASSPVFAEDNMHDMMAKEHGGGAFHMFRFEAWYGGGKDGAVAGWDFDGWIGGDNNKLWLKSEGERADGELEGAEFWALYSRNTATFWDVQIGLRHDMQPISTSYLTMGFNGLAPYFFETEAHLFISDEGNVSARLREENDFLITQQLILQPYAEINLSEDSSGELGLQTRYEFTRKFAPYADVRYEREFSDSSDDFIGSIGLRLMF